jgi:hypothetical protein
VPVRYRITKDQIGGPLALVGRPVVGDGKVVEQLHTRGMELVRDGLQVASPSELLSPKFLSRGDDFYATLAS